MVGKWSQNPRQEEMPMDHHQDPALHNYPHGRGYGHDYMRGGEVFGGYGYADREEYSMRRGELASDQQNGGNRPGGERSS
jgi:hypothetical protein